MKKTKSDPPGSTKENIIQFLFIFLKNCSGEKSNRVISSTKTNIGNKAPLSLENIASRVKAIKPINCNGRPWLL